MSDIFKNLPNDIIIDICRINRINKENEIWKKKHNLMIKHFEYYCDYYQENGIAPDERTMYPPYFVDGDIRVDCQFLEYEDVWNTSLEDAITTKYGKERFYNFADNEF
jgi:hypothetical protein